MMFTLDFFIVSCAGPGGPAPWTPLNLTKITSYRVRNLQEPNFAGSWGKMTLFQKMKAYRNLVERGGQTTLIHNSK